MRQRRPASYPQSARSRAQGPHPPHSCAWTRQEMMRVMVEARRGTACGEQPQHAAEQGPHQPPHLRSTVTGSASPNMAWNSRAGIAKRVACCTIRYSLSCSKMEDGCGLVRLASQKVPGGTLTGAGHDPTCPVKGSTTGARFRWRIALPPIPGCKGLLAFPPGLGREHASCSALR